MTTTGDQEEGAASDYCWREGGAGTTSEQGKHPVTTISEPEEHVVTTTGEQEEHLVTTAGEQVY